MSYEFDYRDPPEFYNEVVQLAMSGLTLKEIGEYFCLDPHDWIEFCANHCLVELKFQHGKAKGIALAGARLLREVNAGKINAITFYLKTQGNFTEKQAIQLENITPAPPPMPPVPADPVEAAKTYQHYMQGS